MVKLFHSNLFLILMAPRFKFSLGCNVNHWIKSLKLHNEIVVLNSIFFICSNLLCSVLSQNNNNTDNITSQND